MPPLVAAVSAVVSVVTTISKGIKEIASLFNKDNTGLNSGQLATAITDPDPGSQQSERSEERRERRQAEEQREQERQVAELNDRFVLQEQFDIPAQIFQT